MPVEVTVRMHAEIDSPVYPADDPATAMQNIGGLFRDALSRALEAKALFLADGSLSPEQRAFAEMQLDAEITAWKALLEGLKVDIDPQPVYRYEIIKDPEPEPPGSHWDLFLVADHAKFSHPFRDIKVDQGCCHEKTHHIYSLYADFGDKDATRLHLDPSGTQVGFVAASREFDDPAEKVGRFLGCWNAFLSGDVWAYLIFENNREATSEYGYYDRARCEQDVAREMETWFG